MARVHHVNCTTMCPLGGRLINGEGSLFDRGRMVCHCLVIESKAGIVVVDTGLFATSDFDDHHRVDVLTRANLGATPSREELLRSRVEALGFSVRDVKHVIPTI